MLATQDAFSNCLRAIAEAQEVFELREATKGALALLGAKAAYCVAPLNVDQGATRIVATVGLSANWDRHYRNTLHAFDPLPRIAVEQAGAFRWPEAIDMGALDEGQRRYLVIAKRHGLTHGVGTACYGPNGRSSFLGLILPEDSGTLDDSDILHAHTIGQFVFQRYCALVKTPAQGPPLSKREVEVLQLISRGKSNPIIAEILQISPSSVDAYVRRIFAKLDVTDRTTASTKALSMGIIVPWDHERLARQAAERNILSP